MTNTIHRGEYPPDWDKIAREVKDRAGWQCENCEASHAPQEGYGLTVHHLDMDKSNCHWTNLVALCQKCHLRVQSRKITQATQTLPGFEHVWLEARR